ncbi:MAG: hypothetical protein ABI602_00895 [Candidatus Saccharibacteria bacterium]
MSQDELTRDMIKATSQHTRAVLTPSILSGIVMAVLAVGTVFISLVATYGSSGVLQQGLGAAHSLSAPTYHQITDSLARNPVASNAPLFLLWAAIGIIVYLFAVNIVSALGHGVQMEEELNYVNVPRRKLIRYEIMLLFIRLAVLLGWLLYLQVFVGRLLPFALAVVAAARSENLAVEVGQIIVVTGGLFIGLHLHLVFLRLLLLKTRLFADQDDS